ncbi:FHA domain-containing protein [Paraliomyxa miuraensis]|uniref:FHA domain-containing protein n=1 Tax=Paraliomyxa miuraensis TaxID=376150 RepID=UPI0022545294|nr:FHA domain-containing protein [Paraliomyxa miuraensis]MCX4244563.1 FHA domain-containing protein [Paraliomyxa miuraensis]
MSAPIPCPCCGSDIGPGHEACSTCGYGLGPVRESNAGGGKCARCGAMMPSGFDFCPVCGQDQRNRLRRPSTQEIRLGVAGVARSSGSMAPPPVAHRSPSMGPPVGSHPVAAAGRTVVPSSPSFAPPPPPSHHPQAEAGAYVPIDRTVPAPSLSLQGQAPLPPPPAPRLASSSDSLLSAVADAHTMEPRGGMPAVHAEVNEDGRTVPETRRAAAGPRPVVGPSDDARTIPHQRMQPVAISPVRAAAADATQPDRPGGFSGGPGHGPLPTVNRAKSSTLAPIEASATPRGSPAYGVRGVPRLVLVARDGSEGESFPIQGELLTIGRTHGDLLFPEDPFLSPLHVRLQWTANGIGLFDAGSTNGVYLRIKGSAPVYPGDQFMIGHQLLRLENIDTQVQERPPAIDGTRVFGTPLQPAWGCVRQVGRGGIVGDKYYLRGSQVVFGREGGDLLFPNDPFVSREHARLRLELRGQTMAVFLEDLESANGSYIRIRGSAEMASMDTFRIGDQILRLRLD